MNENKEKNKNIEVITGDPKRAIRKLSYRRPKKGYKKA